MFMQFEKSSDSFRKIAVRLDFSSRKHHFAFTKFALTKFVLANIVTNLVSRSEVQEKIR